MAQESNNTLVNIFSQVSYYTLVKQWIKTSLSIDVLENLDYMNGVNKTILKYTYQIYILNYIFLRASLNETFTAKYDGVSPGAD